MVMMLNISLSIAAIATTPPTPAQACTSPVLTLARLTIQQLHVLIIDQTTCTGQPTGCAVGVASKATRLELSMLTGR